MDFWVSGFVGAESLTSTTHTVKLLGVGRVNEVVEYNWFLGASPSFYDNESMGSLNISNSSLCLTNRTAHHEGLSKKKNSRGPRTHLTKAKIERK